jgi:hypothetical protein
VLRALFTGHRNPFAFQSFLHHLAELGFHPGFEVRLDLVDLGELGEGPATVLPVVVYPGYPVGLW